MQKDTNSLPISALQLKWKRKHLFAAMLFSLMMVVLSGLDMFFRNRLVGSYSVHTKLIFVCCSLPICLTLITYYAWVALKEYRNLETVIKRERIKFFKRGIYCSSLSFTITLINLLMSITEVSSTSLTISSWISISLCIFLGTASVVLISIYEFCACWDSFYHKNKEILIKEHLARQQKLKINKK